MGKMTQTLADKPFKQNVRWKQQKQGNLLFYKEGLFFINSFNVAFTPFWTYSPI